MSKNEQSTAIVQQDYDAIQAAVMETERGRWFLTEFAQRNRVSDTDMLLTAIQKLETTVAEKTSTPAQHPDVERIRFDIADMASAIAETKQQISSINAENSDNSHLDTATAELDAIVSAAETATSDILQAAENIQEVAWTAREEGVGETDLDKLDEFVTNIYTACSFQDITGQRISKVINVLQFLEARVEAMMNIWDISVETPTADTDIPTQPQDPRADSHLLNGPQLEGEGVEQGEIDLMLADEAELFEAVVQTQDQMAGDPETVEIIAPIDTKTSELETAAFEEALSEEEPESFTQIEQESAVNEPSKVEAEVAALDENAMVKELQPASESVEIELIADSVEEEVAAISELETTPDVATSDTSVSEVAEIDVPEEMAVAEFEGETIEETAISEELIPDQDAAALDDIAAAELEISTSEEAASTNEVVIDDEPPVANDEEQEIASSEELELDGLEFEETSPEPEADPELALKLGKELDELSNTDKEALFT